MPLVKLQVLLIFEQKNMIESKLDILPLISQYWLCIRYWIYAAHAEGCLLWRIHGYFYLEQAKLNCPGS